jgi:hypothetical protein
MVCVTLSLLLIVIRLTVHQASFDQFLEYCLGIASSRDFFHGHSFREKCSAKFERSAEEKREATVRLLVPGVTHIRKINYLVLLPQCETIGRPTLDYSGPVDIKTWAESGQIGNTVYPEGVST